MIIKKMEFINEDIENTNVDNKIAILLQRK